MASNWTSRRPTGVMDGDSDELLDGIMLGAWLGLLLGIMRLGRSVGLSRGISNGDVLETDESIAVGVATGASVGAVLIVMDGDSDGLLDGTMLGAWLGLLLDMRLGRFVGLSLGISDENVLETDENIAVCGIRRIAGRNHARCLAGTAARHHAAGRSSRHLRWRRAGNGREHRSRRGHWSQRACCAESHGRRLRRRIAGRNNAWCLAGTAARHAAGKIRALDSRSASQMATCWERTRASQ